MRADKSKQKTLYIELDKRCHLSVALQGILIEKCYTETLSHFCGLLGLFNFILGFYFIIFSLYNIAVTTSLNY